MQFKDKTAIAFDPSYISKSGKQTPVVGYFWSGVAGRTKWGLELCGLVVIDKFRKTVFHLEAFQTIDIKENEKLIDFYTRKLLDKQKQLLEVSNYLIVNAFFLEV